MGISPITINQNVSFKQTQKTNLTPKQNNTESKPKSTKALPYIAGAIILATSAYAFRNKISKILKKTPEIIENNPIKNETPIKNENLPAKIYKHEFEKHYTPTQKPITENIAPIREEQPVVANINNIVKENLNETPIETVENAPKVKEICVGFSEGKPIYQEIEMPVQGQAVSVYSEALKSVNFEDKSVISKIENIRNSEQHNIERILGENTHNGHVDIPMMKKVANDYMADVNRGETRFHQAADLLEQAHIREHLKGDAKVRDGMFNLTDSMVTDPVLYRCYQNMPLEESANRLNYLKEHDLKSDSFKESMDADGFFNKTFNRLVEKYQMKRYNASHGIE